MISDSHRCRKCGEEEGQDFYDCEGCGNECCYFCVDDCCPEDEEEN